MIDLTIKDAHLANIKRNTTTELFRVFAAFRVVVIHIRFNTPEANNLQSFCLPFCVPFFYVISLTYFIFGLKGAFISDIFKKAWWRIAVPYLALSIIYVGLLIAKNYLEEGSKNFPLWRIIFY